jgi:nicotinamidase/pyrazinamidase
MTALLLIDLQNDFLPGGALAVPKGDQILPAVCRLMGYSFSKKIATKDCHPPDHISFAKTHQKKVGETIRYDGGEQMLWPIHCVMGTKGAQFASGWPSDKIDKVIYKGSLKDLDSYSAFFDNLHKHKTDLHPYLQKEGVKEIVVAGLATDYCVKATVLDALELGYTVTLITDGCQGVDVEKGDSDKALKEMKKEGAHLVTSEKYRGGGI